MPADRRQLRSTALGCAILLQIVVWSPADAVSTSPAGGPGAVVVQAPAPDEGTAAADEMTLRAETIAQFLRVAWFGDDGRYHFSAYSDCSYSFLQNPSVEIGDGNLTLSAEYWRRTATAAGGRCVGGPGANARVIMHARPVVRDGAVVLQISRVETPGAQGLTDVVLAVAGVRLPMDYEVDLRGALNRILHETAPFGIAALAIDEMTAAADGLHVRWRVTLGRW